ALLREHLRPALDLGAAIRFVDMAEGGRNPNRILPWVLRSFIDEHLPRPVRIVGEPIWPGRSPEEIPACVAHEALINVALAGCAATLLCPYDASLPGGIRRYAERTHPCLIEGDDHRTSSGYTDPDSILELLNQPLPEPRNAPEVLVFEANGLARVRHMVAERARHAGLDAERVADLQVAVNEVATNTLAHAAGPGTLRVWLEGDRVICEVRGPGHIGDWLAGRIRPAADSERGRGLLLANRLCDLIQTFTRPETTVTRLHMRR
ncbi:MAG TPA: sensor histidine kinase, partial [Micromonosporaceae bacterium]|nr:sensor histidine kinase [Micromonosporaceae bacterium]